jgi:hypothetical protein
MKNLLIKLVASISREGLSGTLAKFGQLPRILAEEVRVRGALKRLRTPEDRFTWIYESNHWKSKESVSGSGSTIAYTSQLRSELPELLQQLGVKTLFDAPCGDFNWMAKVLPHLDVVYIGADIVKPLVDSLNESHGSDRVTFTHLDLISSPHIKADLMFCRDALFHLSFEDAKSVLRNFVCSGTPYLLTTCHFLSPGSKNLDIVTGDFRTLDLRLEPFGLTSEFHFKIADWVAPDPERYMVLWSRDQVIAAMNSWV